ncbi:threonine--tRNA ligase [Candidatus Woesearchaeota archaeon]|nr:threonine--tRNA ligase [Candidatus Woesearchaeota archaeon]MBU3941551.1 threonine--tRNA ligase [Nanoarchaeota archaeon]
MIKIKFPDGSKKEYEKGISVIEVAKDIGEKLADDAIAAKLNNELVDLSTKINKDSNLRIITFKDDAGKEAFRHSSAHLMAQAIKNLYPDVKFAIGPAVDEGFYYDIDLDKKLTPEDLIKIEKEMDKIVKENLKVERTKLTKKEALNLFKDNPYKTEMINELEDEKISIYKQGNFIDFCRGPHVPSTGKLKAFKLTKLAGAYWRGDAKNKQLQRVYGISFPDKKQLNAYLTLLEEAEKRDHRKLGKELDLFSMHDEGPGFPFFHPNGTVIINILKDFWRKEHAKAGYTEVITPIILNRNLWEQSGHWDHYKENMYFTKIDNQDYAIKPMNCPGGILIYKTRLRSYRELPMRMGEMGIVHRHELSGVLAGLFRVRCFTQDDAHIYMTEEQIKDEIIGVINLSEKFYNLFGFEYNVELSTKPDNAMGSDEAWEKATAGLKDALDAKKMKYKINEGDGAFYGPKIDFHLKDCLGRKWQCGTIQLDFAMPEKFDLTYEGKDGKKHRPIMIHRTIYGSIERFMGILIEHYAGKFPLWLSPTQAVILNINDSHIPYGEKVKQELEKSNIRVETDFRAETMPKKVREAQLKKIPLIITVGDKEVKNKTVAVRTLDGKVYFGIKTEDLIKKMQEIIDNKSSEIKF